MDPGSSSEHYVLAICYTFKKGYSSLRSSCHADIIWILVHIVANALISWVLYNWELTFTEQLLVFVKTLIARFMGPTWAHLGPVGPRWAPCRPHEPYLLSGEWPQTLSLAKYDIDYWIHQAFRHQCKQPVIRKWLAMAQIHWHIY